MHNLKPIKVRKAQNNSISLSMKPAPTTIATETTTTAASCGTITSLPNWTTRPTNSRYSKNLKIQFSRTPALATCNKNYTISNVATTTTRKTTRRQFSLVAILLLLISIDEFSSLTLVQAENFYASTTPLNLNGFNLTTTTTTVSSTTVATAHSTDANAATFDDAPLQSGPLHLKSVNDGSGQNHSTTTTKIPPSNSTTSFFRKFAKNLSTGNELWDGIITDCYEHPTFSCFQKNVYSYLSDALNVNDVNVTQRLKFYRNELDYNEHEHHRPTTEAAEAKDFESSEEQHQIVEGANNDDHLLRNEIPRKGRAGELINEFVPT